MTDAALCAAARHGDKRAIARLVSAFEDPRSQAAPRRAAILAALADRPIGRVVGLTGAPGVGTLAKPSASKASCTSSPSCAAIALPRVAASA